MRWRAETIDPYDPYHLRIVEAIMKLTLIGAVLLLACAGAC